MNEHPRIVSAAMNVREREKWTPMERKKGKAGRLLKAPAFYALALLCLCAGGTLVYVNHHDSAWVMSHVSAGFEYDETLGRLQFVSNILPESAMVFLNSAEDRLIAKPAQATASHDWSQEEPWLEYACSGEISACMDGEIVTVVKNREDEYTIRMLHDNGYESIYSGLNTVLVTEGGYACAAEALGTANGSAAFELRRDGLSILPAFGEI